MQPKSMDVSRGLVGRGKSSVPLSLVPLLPAKTSILYLSSQINSTAISYYNRATNLLCTDFMPGAASPKFSIPQLSYLAVKAILERSCLFCSPIEETESDKA